MVAKHKQKGKEAEAKKPNRNLLTRKFSEERKGQYKYPTELVCVLNKNV